MFASNIPRRPIPRAVSCGPILQRVDRNCGDGVPEFPLVIRSRNYNQDCVLKKRSGCMFGNNHRGDVRKQSALPSRIGNSRSLAVLATIVGVATAAWAFEKTTKPAETPQGLAGILPAEVPSNL